MHHFFLLRLPADLLFYMFYVLQDLRLMLSKHTFCSLLFLRVGLRTYGLLTSLNLHGSFPYFCRPPGRGGEVEGGGVLKYEIGLYVPHRV